MRRRSSLSIFTAVQNALFIRELKMRFSINRIGLFWTFFEPFIQISLFVFVKVFIFGSQAENFDFAVFLALNFTAFNLFRNIVNKSMGAFTANKALFMYKQVKPISTIFARTLVEVFITSILMVLFIIIGTYFDFDMDVKNILFVILGYLWVVIFAFSVALFLAVSNTFVLSISKIISVVMYALLFASAVFYSLDILSAELREILLWNPLVHFMEFIHGNYFYTLNDDYVSMGYMLIWTITPLFLGFWFYERLERKIISL